MADVNTDTERMRRSIQRAKEKMEVVKNATQSLYNAIDELGGTWSGGNHDEFVEDFNRHYEMMENLDANVTDYLARLEEVAAGYDRCDEEVMDISRKVRV